MAKPFATLTQYSTDKKAYLYGLLPSISTLLTLMAMAAVIALAPVLWASATLQASVYLSTVAYTALAITGVATLNFWFNREIQFYTLGCAPINPGDNFGHIHMVELVNHLVNELNLHDGTQDPNHPNHLLMPRLGKFSKMDPKIVTIPGRGINASALYFSEGMLNEKITKFSQLELAGLIMAELYQIKRRRSIPDTLLGLVDSLNQSLNNLMSSSNLYLQTLGYLLVPLKICFYIHNAILRTHAYEAAKVVVECGRGHDYYNALERKGHAARTKKRSSSDYKLRGNLQKSHILKRDPYLSPCCDYMQSKSLLRPVSFVGKFLDWLLKPIADWVDDKEFSTDDKTSSYRGVVFFDIVLRYAAFYLKEIHSSKPSGPNLKGYLSSLLRDDDIDKRPYSVDTDDRYEPIDPIENIKYRFKRASLLGDKGALTFGKVRELAPDNHCVLEYAQHARKQCKERISRFLDEKGIKPSKDELAAILEPLIFRHNLETKTVDIEDGNSREMLNAYLLKKQPPQQQQRLDIAAEDLNPLYATDAISGPELR